MNDDDPKLKALTSQIRKRDGLADPRWDALAEGSLSEEEEAELRARPPRPGSSEPPYDAFRPLDAGERADLADGVFAALDAKAGAREPAGKAPVEAAPRVRSIASARRSRFALLLAAALCVAVGAGLILTRTGPGPEAIATYSLSIAGGNKTHLADPSSPGDVVRLDAASRIELTLRPEAPIEGAIAVRSFVVQGDAAKPWDAPALAGKGGVIRIEGTASALLGDLAAGTWDLVIVVGRPEAMPSEQDLLRAVQSSAGAPPKGLQILRARVIFSGGAGTTGSIEGERGLELAGCDAVLAGPVCELGEERAVRFWVGARPETKIEVTAGGARVAAEETRAKDGVRVAVKVPAGARELSITATESGVEQAVTLKIAIAEAEPMPAVREAEARMRSGELDAAEEKLAAAEGSASPAARVEIKRIRARIELARGHGDRGAAMLGEAALLDREAGRVSAEFEDRFALAFTLTYQGRKFAEARRAIDALSPLFHGYPEGRAKAPYYLGLIAFETGDLRAALRLFRASSDGAERLGLSEYRSAVLEPWAEALAVLGRSEEAMALLREAEGLLPAGGAPCRRAHFANNLGWTMLRADDGLRRSKEAGASQDLGQARGPGASQDLGQAREPGASQDLGQAREPASAAAPLEEALALARRACPAGLGDVLTNLALAELERDKPDAARRYLGEARRAEASPSPRIEVWWKIIESRLALREGRAAAALAAAGELRAAGEEALLPEMVFEGALGQAEALDALGRSRDARAAYAEADRALDAWALKVPLGEGRDTFLAQHRRSTRLRVDFLLREAARAGGEGKRDTGTIDPAREALAAARRGLARFVSALRWADRVSELSTDARARWDDAVAAYRRERAVLEEKAAGDAWRAPGAKAAREAERARLREALDQALAQLGSAPATIAEEADLPAPLEGETLLVYHPIREGFAGFALSSATPGAGGGGLSSPASSGASGGASSGASGSASSGASGGAADGSTGGAADGSTGGTITWRRLGDIDPSSPPDRLAAALLEPFRDVIKSAARIRFTAYGPLSGIDFHALPWDGRPLLERAPVTYGLDLPGGPSKDASKETKPGDARPAAPRAGGLDQQPIAIVIADPTEDLPGARRSAGRIAERLERSGMRVVRIEGRDASHEAVRDAIERSGATLLHYAGHAVFEGLDGWEAGLRLAQSGRLTVADIMALSRVPAHVVLAGCDTGRAAAEGDGSGGFGLAQAFLMRGARAVIATSRPLSDELAERAGERLYKRDASAEPEPVFDLASALRSTQRELARDAPGSDWAIFRALVP